MQDLQSTDILSFQAVLLKTAPQAIKQTINLSHFTLNLQILEYNFAKLKESLCGNFIISSKLALLCSVAM